MISARHIFAKSVQSAAPSDAHCQASPVRIIDPETGEALPVDQPGTAAGEEVNFMKGYLNQPEKTAEVLKDGWYNTGDIAAVDEDGFLRITDRLSRFSRSAGRWCRTFA